jgi:hypothetical protein
MADIRINALATTAASTASDDFVAVDGSANGTRKLNAFSPTFGGNLTVSGTGTSSFAGPVTGTSSTNGYQWTLTGSGIGGPSIALDATNATVANRYSGLTLFSGGTFQWGLQLRAGDGKFHIYDGVRTVSALTVDVGPLSGVAGTTTVGGNLTVSGTGNSSVAGTLLVATTTNSSNGKLQLATHTTSAGGIGFGPSSSLYIAGPGDFRFVSSSIEGSITLLSGGTYVGSVTSGKSTYLVSGGGVTALTLDSSQRCILAGALRLNNAYVSGAPTATGYVTLQDSAGNTYKVLVGT